MSVRADQSPGDEIDLAHEPGFTLGRLDVSPSTREIRSAGGIEIVEPRVMQALVCLVRSEGAVVSRDDLIRRCWGGRIVGEDAINRCIAKVRQIAERDDGPAFVIETIPRVGYRLRRAPPEPATAAPVPEAIAAVAIAADSVGPAPAPADLPHEPNRSRRWALAAVPLLAVVLGIGYFAHMIIATQHTAAPRLSIAVLPFRNFGDNPSDDYLADAVGDDLTTDLSHIPGSVVIARRSVEAYKPSAAGVGRIGKELGVRYLLEGSLRHAGDTIRINAQLIDTETEAHLWAERFDVKLQQLAEAQTTIVRHIASALHFTLVQIAGQSSLNERPDDPDALDLFFRARSKRDREDTLAGLADAQPLLEKAISLQPDFVDAMGELAWLLLDKARNFDDPTDAADMAEARKLIDRAMVLAPRNARVLAAHGFLLKLEGRCQEATASYQLALSFDANDIDARDGLALCAANLGHPDQAAQDLRDILLIDPQDPNNRARYHQLGLVTLMMGQGDEAIEWLLKAEAGDPAPTGPDESLSRREWNEIGLIAAQSLTGRVAEAKARYAAYIRLWPHRTVWRLASYFTKAEAALPGFQAILDGLKAAGMPVFADETPDDDAPVNSEPKAAGDFEPTPRSIPGARTADTPELAALVAAKAPPTVIDVGSGAAVIPGAVLINETFPSPEALLRLKSAAEQATEGSRDRPLVIMGSNRYDWNSHNAAVALIGLGYRNVSWYRGGEESWAAAGMKAEDHRNL